MSNDAKFVDGLRVYAPRGNAPDFIIANLVVTVDELQAWLANRSGTVRIDIKKSQGGKLYATENDYKPDGSRDQSTQPKRQEPKPDQGGFEDDDIPF